MAAPRIHPQLTDEQRERLLDVAAKCPVQRVLEGSASINAALGIRT